MAERAPGKRAISPLGPFEPPCHKQVARQQARAARAAQRDKEALSRAILAKALSLPEYRGSGTVMFYVDVRDEVRTRVALRNALQTDKRIAVPYCDQRRLGLFRLTQWQQLAIGRYGVLEPRAELRVLDTLRMQPDQIELVLVPGVAFDRHGSRIGRGQGYYDRLLADMPVQTVLVGLAFECQVLPDLETDPHDISMDRVVTQSHVYVGRGRSSPLS